MEIIIKPENIDIEKYIDSNINNFLLPLDDYSVSYTSYFKLEQIKEIKDKYPTAKIFVSIDKNIFNSDIEPLKEILKELDKLGIKAIFFYDLALIRLKKELGLEVDLVWNQTHMVTNYKTCNYYFKNNVKYALLSKEITKDEIIQIINKSEITPIVELISYPSIAFSKRKLISNYYENLQRQKSNTLIINEKVSNSNYYLREDKNGVLFLKNSIMNGCFILDELLKNNLKYVLLKEDLFDEKLLTEIVKNIDYYINNYKDMKTEEKDEWLKKQSELIGEDTSFFFKKTIYRVK